MKEKEVKLIKNREKIKKTGNILNFLFFNNNVNRVNYIFHIIK